MDHAAHTLRNRRCAATPCGARSLPVGHLHKSTEVTTNQAFAAWGEVIPNATCVASLVDRLMHRAEVVRIEGPSLRKKQADE